MSAVPPFGPGLTQRNFGPVGNSFTTGAAVELGFETGAPVPSGGIALPANTSFGCVAVNIENPLTGDTGVAQIDNILVGIINPGVAISSANVKYVWTLQPGQSIRLPVNNLADVWIKAASNTPICKYFLERANLT